jgi:hypothetical protein
LDDVGRTAPPPLKLQVEASANSFHSAGLLSQKQNQKQPEHQLFLPSRSLVCQNSDAKLPAGPALRLRREYLVSPPGKLSAPRDSDIRLFVTFLDLEAFM